MYWLILGALCALFAVTALVLWQKWAAPWPQIEQLVSQIARGEHPSTFLINGGADPHRIGLALENIFARQQELERQIARRESGTQTILGAMQDGVLVVDARSRITLMNPTFEKLFDLHGLAVGVPLVEAVRYATLGQLIAETLSTGNAIRSELNLADSRTRSQRGFSRTAQAGNDNQFLCGISTWRLLKMCWRAPLILITCAGILTRNVEPISQAHPFLSPAKLRYRGYDRMLAGAKFRRCCKDERLNRNPLLQ